MSKNHEHICLNESQLFNSFVNHESVESLLWKYLFPPIFLIGLFGNLIDLFVLFSPGMRNRANYLLSALGLADLTFLLATLPHCLANYTTFALNSIYRYFYFHAKFELIAMANWSSVAAIWLVLAVCLDRLIGIKSPLYACKEWTPLRTWILFLGIVVGTGLLTSFNHFAFQCFYWNFCNGTQIYSKCFSVVSDTWLKNQTNPNPQWLRDYVRFGTTLQAMIGYFLPTIALIGINVALVRELKKRTNNPLLAADGPLHRPSDGAIQRRQERKVTIIVCAIVCCFILTQLPTCALMLWNFFFNDFQMDTNPVLYEIGRSVIFITAIGKSSNFFFFCFISASFRLRLLNLLAIQKKTNFISSQISRLYRRLDSMATNEETNCKKNSNGSSSKMTGSGKGRASVPLLNPPLHSHRKETI